MKKIKKLNILMISPTPFFADRGCHVRIYEEAMALQNRGHKITIVTYHIGNTPKNLKVIRIPPIIFWYNKLEAGPAWSKFLLDGILFLKTLQLIIQNKYDIIHGHLHEGALIGKIATIVSFKKIPVIFDYQGSLTGEILAHHFIEKNKKLYSLFKLAEKIINKISDFIICSSSPGVINLIENYKVAENKVKFIRDGIGQQKKIVTKKQINKLKNKFHIPKSKSIIVYLGILSKYQGLDLLLESIKIIIRKNKNIHFLIMGYPNVDLYKNKSVELGIDKYVTFTGKTSYLQIYDYLSLGNVAVSPKLSKTEANGKLYNYMAAGLPTVAFDSKVNREILGDLGIYAKYNDSSDFAKKIIWTLKNNKQASILAKKGKKLSVSNYSWLKSIKNLENVYYNLLKNYGN